MFGTASSLVRNEGVLAMYKGLSAALLRQVVYGGIGIGFYGPVRCDVILQATPLPVAMLVTPHTQTPSLATQVVHLW